MLFLIAYLSFADLDLIFFDISFSCGLRGFFNIEPKRLGLLFFNGKYLEGFLFRFEYNLIKTNRSFFSICTWYKCQWNMIEKWKNTSCWTHTCKYGKRKEFQKQASNQTYKPRVFKILRKYCYKLGFIESVWKILG